MSTSKETSMELNLKYLFRPENPIRPQVRKKRSQLFVPEIQVSPKTKFKDSISKDLDVIRNSLDLKIELEEKF